MALGLSQEALARKCDLSVGAVSRLERGVIEDPNSSTLARIAAALGVTTHELLRDAPTEVA